MNHLNMESEFQEGQLKSQKVKEEYHRRDIRYLEMIVSELKQNIAVLKDVISNLLSGDPQVDSLLLSRNEELEHRLEQCLIHLRNCNTEIFLLKQIGVESEKDHQQILTHLEDKILELRRLIQSKEAFVQQLETERNLESYDDQPTIKIVPPNSITLEKYISHNELKQQLQTKSAMNRSLAQENQNLRGQNRILIQQVSLFKEILSSRGVHLLQKSQQLIKVQRSRSLNRMSINHYGPAQRVYPQGNNSFRIPSALLSNSNFLEEINEMMKTTFKQKKLYIEQIRKLRSHNQQLIKAKESLISSNTLYRQTRKAFQDKYNRQKQLSMEAIQLLMQRKPSRRSLSHQKWRNPVKDMEKYKLKNKNCGKLNNQKRREHLLQMKCSLLGLETRSNSKKICKSNSCLFDYISCSPLGQSTVVPSQMMAMTKEHEENSEFLQHDFSIIKGASKQITSQSKNDTNFEELIIGHGDDLF